MTGLHALWNDLWPNVFAPSVWVLPAVVISHVKSARQRERHHQDMKQHVTATAGGSDDQGTRLRARRVPR